MKYLLYSLSQYSRLGIGPLIGQHERAHNYARPTYKLLYIDLVPRPSTDYTSYYYQYPLPRYHKSPPVDMEGTGKIYISCFPSPLDIYFQCFHLTLVLTLLVLYILKTTPRSYIHTYYRNKRKKKKKREMMRSVVFHGPYKVAVEERPIPKILDPKDIIVKVRYTALCGR